MIGYERLRIFSPLLGFGFLLVAPGAMIWWGVVPFALRFHMVVAVAALCMAATALAGYSYRELGLDLSFTPGSWLGCCVLTITLAFFLLLEASLTTSRHAHPAWTDFAPFYVLISSPCQEIVCRSIPKLIADRLQMNGRHYVVYSAAMFSLMHTAYGDPVLLANTFVAGVAWGTAYLCTRNLWPLICSHAVVGMLAFLLGMA